MKRSISIIIICFISISFLVTPLFAQEKIERITFDGYWWVTLNPIQKVGYVQGYIDAASEVEIAMAKNVLKIAEEREIVSQEVIESLRSKQTSWTPYDHSFGYYIERIDGYYKMTKDVNKLVMEIMNELRTVDPATKSLLQIMKSK